MVPVPFRKKGCELLGWPGLTLAERDLPNYFPPGTPMNIGVLLGAPSGGLIDIDLDCPEAVAAACHLLPATGRVSGRAGKPRSHYWYKVADPPAKASEGYLDLGKKKLVELRSTGGQTVVPPSVHETGEAIVWHDPVGPAERVEIGVLRTAVGRLAAAALLARHWPEKPGRHDAHLPLAGALLHAGWPEEDVSRFVAAVAAATGDEEAAARLRDVVSTAERAAAGERTTGWPTLAQHLTGDGGRVVDRARGWLGLRREYATPAAAPLEPEWPAPPGEEAFHGLAGDFVRAVDPHTEADPVALVGQFLVGFGNLVGRGPYFRVEADRHYTNEFILLVGKTAKARKGTSWGRTRAALDLADSDWVESRVHSGLSSGEGFIWAVRDEVEKQERVKERGQPVRYETVVADPGVKDKRLLVIEPEFANVLKQAERQGNTLSVQLRQAWDRGDLSTLTKTPVKATGAHVSVVGHITVEELRRYLTATEVANGFANRFIQLAVKRSKLLPHGGRLDPAALAPLKPRLADAVAFARRAGEVTWDPEGRALWHDIYADLSRDRDGVAGSLLARAEAHVTRVATLYALLDRSPVIRAEHLLAAVALWEYAERSVLYVFGDATGDPVADDIDRLLRANPGGVTRSGISQYLGRNVPADSLNRALGLLLRTRRARREERESGDRPAEWWFPVP